VAIPSDPTNESRALKLLASKGLIEVTDNPITLKDVKANPKNLKFTEIENASLPQALNDKDAAIVTLAFALPAGLSADKQLLVEGKDSAYYNVLAVKAEMKDDPRVQKLFKILTSQEMKDFINTKFKGARSPRPAKRQLTAPVCPANQSGQPIRPTNPAGNPGRELRFRSCPWQVPEPVWLSRCCSRRAKPEFLSRCP
jgi:hypothetical protein